MSKEYVFQFLVQFPDNHFNESKLSGIKKPILDCLRSFNFSCFLDTRTYMFAGVQFAVFSFISEREISPLWLAKLANKIKQEHNCLFSCVSSDFDLQNSCSFSKTYKLGELRGEKPGN